MKISKIQLLFGIMAFIPTAVILFVLGGIDAVSGTNLVDPFSEFVRRLKKKLLREEAEK